MPRNLLLGPAPLSAQKPESCPQEDTADAGHSGSRSTPLLFVNKDARSLFVRNSKPQSKEISSHVQRVTAHSIRKERIARMTSTAGTRQLAPVLRGLAQTSQDSLDSKENGEGGGPGASVQTPLYSANFTQADNVDPFNWTSVRVTSEVHKLLTYFRSVCTIAIFKFDMDARPSQRHHCADHFDQMVRKCLENELHMYTVLAVAAGRLTNLTHQPYTMVSPSIAQHLMCKAVECLRKYFASDEDRLSDKHIIATLTCVSSFEWYLGDYEAARIHLRAVKHPFGLLDESCEYDRWIIAMASHPDLYMAVETLSLPVLPAKGPGPHSGPIPPMSIGQSLKALVDRAYFGALMAPVITDLLRCMQVWKSLTPSASESDVIWTGQQIHFIMYQLLLIGSKTGLKIAEECCRIALIIELTYLVTLTSKRSGPLNAGRLQKALGRIGPRPRDVVEQELLLWLMITALLAANEKDADEPLTQKAVELALDLKINTYPKLVCLMARFIWVEKLQEPLLHQFWARIAIASDWISPGCRSSTDGVKQPDGLDIVTVSARVSEIVQKDYNESSQAKS